ncbi:hypothetical protein [Sphingomonas colocasiae]|uniref:Uncharacterized protein n=1 Tax=Sphingomonas colocasiae TaxID=1848973 RepID=A0ABS7PM05_9SPHN|nr:hypothetical protein [Sphingomonas colocasiae]MBY8822306.1 hypothetical protein [Sphingomonas colocasiae]
MRYFLDTEFNGFGGALISIALVPEFGDEEFYAILPMADPVVPWVDRHVMPYLHMVPPALDMTMRADEAAHEVARYLAHDPKPVIVADWPDDIAYFCKLLVIGNGVIVDIDDVDFSFLRSPGFSPAANSKVPHNALHDARALRDFVLGGR